MKVNQIKQICNPENCQTAHFQTSFLVERKRIWPFGGVMSISFVWHKKNEEKQTFGKFYIQQDSAHYSHPKPNFQAQTK